MPLFSCARHRSRMNVAHMEYTHMRYDIFPKKNISNSSICIQQRKSAIKLGFAIVFLPHRCCRFNFVCHLLLRAISFILLRYNDWNLIWRNADDALMCTLSTGFGSWIMHDSLFCIYFSFAIEQNRKGFNEIESNGEVNKISNRNAASTIDFFAEGYWQTTEQIVRRAPKTHSIRSICCTRHRMQSILFHIRAIFVWVICQSVVSERW